VKRSSFVLALLAAGCVADAGEEQLATTSAALTVDQEIAKATCSTSSAVVQGLSDQILDEISKCLKPGVLVKVVPEPKIAVPSTHAYLIKPAYDALKKAAASRTDTINVSSMFRTVAQQYFLWRRSSCYPAVAAPGSSNHETGIAIDVSDPDNSNWRSVLSANGFKWLGSFDRFHFDYVGSGTINLRGQDVLAFQRLWNRNNPGDKIGEDGDWGPQTEARLKKSPATGFPIGADCGPPPPPMTKPWPSLELEATAEGQDRFSDGPSAAITDVMEGDEYYVNLIVRNNGTDVAKDVTLGVWLEDPFVLAVHYDIESDWMHPGTFELNDANARPDNPPHDAPGKAFAVKINNVSPKETKRIRIKTKAVRYSIGAADAPDVRVWVQDVPGVYTKADFGATPSNVDGRQTFNAGDLKAWAPVDIYSRVRWSFDGGMFEGWDINDSADGTAEDKTKGLMIKVKADDPQLIGPETTFAAADYTGIAIKGSSTLGGSGRIYFATSDAPGFDESRAIDFTMPSTGTSAGEVTVRLADHVAWKGNVTRLRIDPAASGTGDVVIDDIRMLSVNGKEPGATPRPEETPQEITGGCGCGTSAQSAGGLWLLGVLALLGLRRRPAR
jgi:MYXO-CTERM domain-containing protein